jgi:8-oxo-dGTP pyrophosphatase MutT (NUDIX family)
MNKDSDLLHIIRKAVHLKDFDTRAARIPLSPVGRIPERPEGLAGSARTGSVLIVLYAAEKKLHVILIKRRDDLRHHPGQVSFPGGRRENGEDALACALRETREEIGIAPGSLVIAGPLEPAYIIVSDFCIDPFVAWHSGIPACIPEPMEVDAIYTVPLRLLCAPDARECRQKNILGTPRSVPGFLLYGHHIWGATAMLLHEMIERLKAAGWRE